MNIEKDNFTINNINDEYEVEDITNLNEQSELSNLSTTDSSPSWKYATTSKSKTLSPTSLKIQVPPATFFIDESDKNILPIITNTSTTSTTVTNKIRASTSFSSFPNSTSNNSISEEKSHSDFVRKPPTSKNLPLSTNNSNQRKQTLIGKVKNVFVTNSNNNNNNNSNNNSLIIDKNNDESIISYKDKFSINILDTFNLTDSEIIVSEHPCAYRRKISKAGKLYITTNYFCFYSLIFNKEIKKYSHFKDVLSIKRVSSVILGNSIEITTTFKKYVFGMFENTEIAFKALTDQHKLSLSNKLQQQSQQTQQSQQSSKNVKLHPSTSTTNFEKKRNRFFSVSIQSPTKSILKETNHPIIINNNVTLNTYSAPNSPLSIIPQNSSNNSNGMLSTSPPSNGLPPLSPLSSSPITSTPSIVSLASISSPTTPTLNSTPPKSIQESKLKIETRSRSGSLPTFYNKSNKKSNSDKNKNNNLNYLLSPVKDKDSKIVLAAEEDQESLNSGSGSGGDNTPTIASSPISSSPYLSSSPLTTTSSKSNTINKPIIKHNRSESHKSIAFGQNILISLFSSSSNKESSSPPVLSPRNDLTSSNGSSYFNNSETGSYKSTFINSDTFDEQIQAPPISPRERSNTTALIFKPFKKQQSSSSSNSSSPSSPSLIGSPNNNQLQNHQHQLNHMHKESLDKLNKMLITRNARGDVQQYCFKEDVFGIPLESMRLLDDGYPIFLYYLINHLESTKESIESIYLNKLNKNNNRSNESYVGNDDDDDDNIQILKDDDYDNVDNVININGNNQNYEDYNEFNQNNINSTGLIKNEILNTLINGSNNSLKNSNNTIFNIEEINNNNNIELNIDENENNNNNNQINSSNNNLIKKITIQSLIKLVTRGKEDAYKNLGDLVQANLLGELLIHFFKVLPNSILPEILLSDLLKGMTEEYDEKYKLSFIRSIIFSQPQIHWSVLKSLLGHLNKLIQIEVKETLPKDIIEINDHPIYKEKLDIIQNKVSNIFGPILFKINSNASLQQHDMAIIVTLYIIKNYNLIFDNVELDQSSYMVKKGNQIVKHTTVNQVLLKLLDYYYKDDTFLEIVNLCHNDYFLSTELYIQSLIQIYGQEKHREFLNNGGNGGSKSQFSEFRMKIRERSLFLIRSLIEFKPMFWSDLDECSTSLELIQEFTEKYFDGPTAGSALPIEEFKYFQFFNDFYKRILNFNGGYNYNFSTTPTSASSLSYNNYYGGFGSSNNSSVSSSQASTPPTTPLSSNIPPNPMNFSSDSIQVQRQLQNFMLGASRLQQQSESSSKKFNLVDMDSTQVAIQITLIDEKAFRMISVFELLKKKFVRPDLSPNFQAMVQLFNRWSSWVGSEILNCTTPTQRAMVIEKFIEIATILKNLKNFHCSYACTQGIYHYSIKRLYLTWDKVSKKSMNQFEELQKIFSPDSNHKNYREVLNSSSPPLIPYLGLYTKDLLFAEDSNPNFIVSPNIPSVSIEDDEELYKSTQLINFEKLRIIHQIIKNLKFYRSNPYPMPSNIALRDRILSRPILNDDEMFDKSLLLEPRRQTQSVLPLPNLKTQQVINNLNNNNNNNN